MAKKIIIKEPKIVEQIIEIPPIKPIKIKKLGVEVPPVIIEPVIVKEIEISAKTGKPKRVMSGKQLQLFHWVELNHLMLKMQKKYEPTRNKQMII